nr:immunoglobulin light chain junction region [Macaca mulatta]
CLQGHITPFTF